MSALSGRDFPQRPPQDADFPPPYGKAIGEQAHHSSLAGAVGTNHGDEFTRADAEVECTKEGLAPVAGGDSECL